MEGAGQTALTLHQIEDAPSRTVLGVKVYNEGTLIRGSNGKIYAVSKDQKLKHVLNLKELAKYYLGKQILNVHDDVIRSYDTAMDSRRKKANPKTGVQITTAT